MNTNNTQSALLSIHAPSGEYQVAAGGNGTDLFVLTSAQQGSIVTGGGGTDIFAFLGGAASSGPQQIVKITDFVAGTDKIGLLGMGIHSIAMAASTTIAHADTLAQIYSHAGSAPQVAAESTAARLILVSAGLAAGTYLAVDTNHDGHFTNTTDLLVNITGVTGTVGAGDFLLL